MAIEKFIFLEGYEKLRNCFPEFKPRLDHDGVDKTAKLFFESISKYFTNDDWDWAVNKLMHEGQKFPKLFEISNVLKARLKEKESKFVKCEICDGFGNVTMVFSGYDYNASCDCLNGQGVRSPNYKKLESIGHERKFKDLIETPFSIKTAREFLSKQQFTEEVVD